MSLTTLAARTLFDKAKMSRTMELTITAEALYYVLEAIEAEAADLALKGNRLNIVTKTEVVLGKPNDEAQQRVDKGHTPR